MGHGVLRAASQCEVVVVSFSARCSFATLLNLVDRRRSPLMLAKMLDPRFVHEAFDEPMGIRGVVKQVPEVGAVAPAHFSDVLHRGDELGPACRV